MTDHILTTARPSTAAIAWATPDAIFVEYPTKSGVPYIVRYRKNIEGLCAAFNILVERSERSPRAIPKDHPEIKRQTAVSWANDEQRKKTREVLKKMGLTT